jgi:hypothetical protein
LFDHATRLTVLRTEAPDGTAEAQGRQAEIEVARDLIRRGFRIAIPYGEDWDFDLIFQRPGSQALERVQVKHAKPRGAVIPVRTRSSSLTNGKVRAVPAVELGDGRDEISLRLSPTKNCQVKGVRYAEDYVDPAPLAQLSSRGEMEPAGFEPATS